MNGNVGDRREVCVFCGQSWPDHWPGCQVAHTVGTERAVNWGCAIVIVVLIGYGLWPVSR